MKNSLSPIHLTAPDIDVAEVSLFGPGVGECIVIHAGAGHWYVVDSCLSPGKKRSVALEYLESIGVDVRNQVKGILLTHWHSDHIGGAFSLVESCENARIHISSALNTKEALHLAALYKADPFAGTDKEIREFAEIIRHLHQRKEPHRLDPVKARHTFFDVRTTDIVSRLVSLSPSPAAVTQTISNLAHRLPKQGSPRVRNLVPESVNLNAVAIHFSFGQFSAVLGSDLEETGNSNTGWSAVFSSQLPGELSLQSADLFKVSHHGSETGHHDEIWTTLLKSNPISIATAYSRSGLPSDENIERIRSKSAEFILTSRSNASGRGGRDKVVERELRSIVKSMAPIQGKMGHIQIRASSTGVVSTTGNNNCVVY